MNSKTTSNVSAPNRGIDEVLEQTELGSFVAKHKPVIISVIVAAVVGLVALAVYSESKRNLFDDVSKVVYTFEKDVLSKYDEKIKDEQLKEEFLKLLDSAKGTNLIFATGIKTVDLLMEKEKYPIALEILEKISKLKTSNSYLTYLINSRKAVLFENIGEIDKAISTLEGMSLSKTKLLESKRYFDLGRLYLDKGDKEKAKLNLDYLLKEFPTEEEAKYAKILIKKI
ncbi:MAG: hypothetical protein H6622_09700 [Halobacteriovoraceae bacterium]|nr:hypothetical protein [Halobacteriovoraceae bacterium]